MLEVNVLICCHLFSIGIEGLTTVFIPNGLLTRDVITVDQYTNSVKLNG